MTAMMMRELVRITKGRMSAKRPPVQGHGRPRRMSRRIRGLARKTSVRALRRLRPLEEPLRHHARLAPAGLREVDGPAGRLARRVDREPDLAGLDDDAVRILLGLLEAHLLAAHERDVG